MKRLINNGDIFDKYVSFEDKKFRDDTIKQFNWLGHRHIAGTYSGAAYTTSLAENYMANSLRNDSNPKGSLLVAAKNYTDEKLATAGKTLYAHYIRLRDGGGSIFLNYISSKAEPYTIQTLKAEFTTSLKKLITSGYFHSGTAQYFYVDGEYFVVGILKDGGTIQNYQTPTFSSIQDHVEAI